MFKRFILKAAIKNGCDIDGDLFIYRGKLYYVDILNNIYKKVGEPDWIKKIHKIKRFFVTTRIPKY